MVDLPPCVDEISAYYGVPVEIVAAVRKVEGGMVGKYGSVNNNGTVDIGPMQINTWWWEKTNKKNLSSQGISPQEALNNECTNIAIGTWVLWQEYSRYNNWIDAFAAYNTGKPVSRSNVGKRYAQKVLDAYWEIKDQQSFRDDKLLPAMTADAIVKY